MWEGQSDTGIINLSKDITLFKNLRFTMKGVNRGILGGDLENNVTKNTQELIKEKTFAIDGDGTNGGIKYINNVSFEINISGPATYLKNVIGIKF